MYAAYWKLRISIMRNRFPQIVQTDFPIFYKPVFELLHVNTIK